MKTPNYYQPIFKSNEMDKSQDLLKRTDETLKQLEQVFKLMQEKENELK